MRSRYTWRRGIRERHNQREGKGNQEREEECTCVCTCEKMIVCVSWVAGDGGVGGRARVGTRPVTWQPAIRSVDGQWRLSKYPFV